MTSCNNSNAINCTLKTCSHKSSCLSTSSHWIGRKICVLKSKVSSLLSKIADIIAKYLFKFAANGVVASTTPKFKQDHDPIRLEKSSQILRDLGGEELQLPTQSGHSISAMYFNSKKCIESITHHGAILDTLTGENGDKKQIAWIPSSANKLKELIEGIGLSISTLEGREYVSLSPSADKIDNASLISKGAVIYAHGSGHLFEKRRKTIGAFLMKFGMDIIVFNYTGSGKSEGKISEEAMYNDIEAAYQFLKSKGFNDENLLSYGHCVGAGPATDLASRHSKMSLLVDRTFPTMGEFATFRVRKKLRIPACLNFLTSWVEPIMNRCFHFNNQEKIEKVEGGVATMEASADHLIPPSYLQRLYQHATKAKMRKQLTMNGNHDMDIGDHQSEKQVYQFLKQINLV